LLKYPLKHIILIDKKRVTRTTTKKYKNFITFGTQVGNEKNQNKKRKS
jgi:hypothetical protein